MLTLDAKAFLQLLCLERGIHHPFHFLQSIRNVHRFTASVVRGYDVLVNDDKTRTFVCLRVRGGRQPILHLIGKVDTLMHKFNQPVYYEVRILFVHGPVVLMKFHQ